MSNQSVTQRSAVVSVKSLLQREDYRARFGEILGQRAAQFCASVVNISRDQNISECDPHSVIASAIVAASLDLPVDRNLGFAWIVPYKEGGTPRATFQLGAKGVIQLAMRSGQYRRMNAKPINAEAYAGLDSFGEPIINWEKLDETKPAVGFAFAWELVNGFRKTCFWTDSKIRDHASRYSMAFKKGRTSPWQTHYEQMALKTVIKNELSDWGILSVEMQKAFRHDQGAQANIDSEIVYPDGPGSENRPAMTDIAPITQIGATEPQGKPQETPPVQAPATSTATKQQPPPPAADGTVTQAPVVTCHYCKQTVADMAAHNCPEMQAALAEKAAANPPANPAPAASAPSSDDGADALASVDLLCQQSEIQQSTVMLFAKKNKLARDNQNALSELATTKLKNLIKVWPNILPELRQIQGQGEPVA